MFVSLVIDTLSELMNRALFTEVLQMLQELVWVIGFEIL